MNAAIRFCLIPAIHVNLQGVDVNWVKQQLTDYISSTLPKNASGRGIITTHSNPSCGRRMAIQKTEIVRPILDRLYPEWRSENPGRSTFEFMSERDAAQRLVARLENQEEISRRLGTHDASPSAAAGGMHPLIWKAAQAQWSTGHRHEAVLAAAKAVNSHLQTKLSKRVRVLSCEAVGV